MRRHLLDTNNLSGNLSPSFDSSSSQLPSSSSVPVSNLAPAKSLALPSQQPPNSDSILLPTPPPSASIVDPNLSLSPSTSASSLARSKTSTIPTRHSPTRTGSPRKIVPFGDEAVVSLAGGDSSMSIADSAFGASFSETMRPSPPPNKPRSLALAEESDPLLHSKNAHHDEDLSETITRRGIHFATTSVVSTNEAQERKQVQGSNNSNFMSLLAILSVAVGVAVVSYASM